jgi:general secretion pathway protein C
VSLRAASIGPPEGGSSLNLELPPLPLPSTGKLPPPGVTRAAPPEPSVAPPAVGPVPAARSLPGAPASLPPHAVSPRRDPVHSR